MGKCRHCAKTVYQMEGIRVGPPGKEQPSHKACLKCDHKGCTWQLNLGNYTFSDGHVYCKAHNPSSGASYGAHTGNKLDSSSVSITAARDAPKLATINNEVRGPKR